MSERLEIPRESRTQRSRVTRLPPAPPSGGRIPVSLCSRLKPGEGRPLKGSGSGHRRLPPAAPAAVSQRVIHIGCHVSDVVFYGWPAGPSAVPASPGLLGKGSPPRFIIGCGPSISRLSRPCSRHCTVNFPRPGDHPRSRPCPAGIVGARELPESVAPDPLNLG
jgi:hypothetical protein